MPVTTFIGPVRAVILGLALLSACPVALAQQSPGKEKTKRKTNRAQAAQGAPQPTSPATSAPQVVVSTPAPGMQINTASLEPLTTKSPWFADLTAAQARAMATNRPIVAVFSGSDWCKPCIIYEQEVFAKPEFVAFAKDRLILAHFDFPRQKKNQPTDAQLKLNETAAAKLNREGDFPLAVIIAPDGKVLAKTGYIAGGPDAFQSYLKKILPSL